jgi:hypothetical protein
MSVIPFLPSASARGVAKEVGTGIYGVGGIRSKRKHDDGAMVPYQHRAKSKGTASVNALPMVQYSHGRMRVRGKRMTKRRNLAQLNETRPYTIYRFQGLSNFGDAVGATESPWATYGLYPALSAFVGQINLPSIANTQIPSTVDISCVYLPMYCYNLSALPTGRVQNSESYPVAGTDAFANVMYQLCKQTIKYYPTSFSARISQMSFYCWSPCRGQQNSSSGNGIDIGSTYSNYSHCPQVEASKFVAAQAPKYCHRWSDIKLAFSGAVEKSTCMRVSVVNFLKPASQPSRIWTRTENQFNNTTGVFFKDLGDHGFALNSSALSILEENASCGLNTEVPGLIYNSADPLTTSPASSTDWLPDSPSHLNDATSFWESYWSNRLGHPLAWSKNYANHGKHMRVKSTKCISIPGVNKQDPVQKPKQHLETIRYQANKVVNTYTSLEGQNTVVASSIPMAPTAQTACVTTGYSTNAGYSNAHIYGSSRAADDWLLIECDSYQQGIPALSDNPIFQINGLAYGKPCATPGNLEYAAEASSSAQVPVPNGNPTTQFQNWPSFDLAIRSRFDTVNAGKVTV